MYFCRWLIPAQVHRLGATPWARCDGSTEHVSHDRNSWARVRANCACYDVRSSKFRTNSLVSFTEDPNTSFRETQYQLWLYKLKAGDILFGIKIDLTMQTRAIHFRGLCKNLRLNWIQPWMTMLEKLLWNYPKLGPNFKWKHINLYYWTSKQHEQNHRLCLLWLMGHESTIH